MTNIEISLNQTTANRQPSQQNLKPGQKVYLYKDTYYTGKLMRPVERTYPPKWTITLDRGGYEAANVEHIQPIESPHSESEEAEIPKADESENISPPSQTLGTEAEKVSQLEQQIEILQNTVRQLEEENQIIRQQYRELERENQRLKEELTEAKKIIRRAKDISPLMRISRKRVMRLAHNVCMDVQRTVGGWILKMGDKARRFRRLVDIWDILSQENWYFSDIFAPDKLIPLEKIKPPRPRKRPTLPEKEAYSFFTPEEAIERRNLGLPKGSKIA